MSRDSSERREMGEIGEADAADTGRDAGEESGS
jgi:hypothetical protein